MSRAPTAGAGIDQALVEFLRTRRWFGDKGRELRDAHIRDVIAIEWPNSHKPFAVARADVTTDEGTSTYQLFLERGMKLDDALQDPEFLRGLADGFVGNLCFEGEGVRWRIASAGKQPFVTPPDVAITLSKTEQSNSSVIIDRAAILKLFRKLEPGVHPDVEVTRFLTIDRQFMNVPVLLGTIHFEDASGSTVAGMLQELVPSAIDAWSYVLQQVAPWFRGTHDGAVPFEGEARRLGAITRALHDTLASGDAGSDFEMQPVSDRDVAAWVGQATATLDRATDALQRALTARSIGRHEELARAAAAAVPHIRQQLGRTAQELGRDRGSKTRTHGDYHLGQVIRSQAGGRAGDFLVIDFEGEPARPLRERRAHQSPLRDVAGMLRSFAYAAAVAAHEAGAGDDARSREWEQRMRDAFLSGYFATTDGAAAMLPSSRANAERLIALFVTEKIFYELQYELDHRPDWAWIPLSGIEKLAT